MNLTDADLEVEVLPEHGGRLHRIRAYGHDLLRTPSDREAHQESPFYWGAYVMAPWCNRLEPRPYDIDGRRVVLAPNFDDGSTIHGQVFNRAWTPTESGARIEAGGDEWPWRYSVELVAKMRSPTVHLSYRLTNLSDSPMPGGLGLHPWFRVPIRLSLDARSVFPNNAATEPEPVPVSGRFDLRTLAAPQSGLDATWSELHDHAARLEWPDIGVAAQMRVLSDDVYVVIATPDHLGAVAVEPQTHAPHGLRRMLQGEPGGLRRLKPGGSLTLDVEIGVSRLGAAARAR